MSATVVRAAFRTKVAAVITASLGAAGWTFPGDTNEAIRPDAGAKWLTLDFAAGQETQESIGAPGSNRFREVGVCFIDLHTLAGEGNTDIESAADTIRTAFRGWISGTVRSFTADPPSIGAGMSATARAAVRIPYQYDYFG